MLLSSCLLVIMLIIQQTGTFLMNKLNIHYTCTQTEATAKICFIILSLQVCTDRLSHEATAKICFIILSLQVCTDRLSHEATAKVCFIILSLQVCTDRLSQSLEHPDS